MQTLTLKRQFWQALGLLLFINTATLLVAPIPALANHDPEQDCHPNAPNCTPDGEYYLPFNKPQKDLGYRLAKRAYQWKTRWRTHYELKGWPEETYDPAYVHPQTFEATIESQCQNQVDWDFYVNNLGPASQAGRYQVSVNGVIRNANADCLVAGLTLPGEGIHDIKLEVFAPGAATPYLTKTQAVRVRDYLIVLMGDSAASGEGAPEFVRGPLQDRGTWIDRRCHRSSKAAVPLVVEALENADPNSSITFLNFACSGATIGLWEKNEGSGILGPYMGIEPPVEALYGAETHFLPSQVEQLSFALHTPFNNGWNGYPLRDVDMVLTTGGINDVRFAKLAMACLLEKNCHDTSSEFYEAESSSVAEEFMNLAADIPDAYVELRDNLIPENIDPEKVYIMQYPGAYEDGNGQQCQSMLEDVLPKATIQTLLLTPELWGPLTSLGTAVLLSPLFNIDLPIDVIDVLKKGAQGDLKWASDEIEWMVKQAMPELDRVLRKGADDAGFNFIDGIQAKFAKHGYCATTNWIQRAHQASFVQGPWDWVSLPVNIPFNLTFNPLKPIGLGVHAQTKGLMHPNYSGYQAIAEVLTPVVGQLKNRAPIALSETYSVNTAITPVKFDSGPGAGVLLNDYDPNGDQIRAVMVKGPSKGTATLSKDGRLVYTPNPGFSGFDSVYYEVTDGALTSPMKKATLIVSNLRDPKKTWNWIYPTGAETRVVQIGGTAAFPVCNKCDDLVLRLDPERPPGFGRVTLERKNAQWVGLYVQNGVFPPELPYEDMVNVEIGRIVLGVFKPEGSGEIPIRIEGELPPPPSIWSWIFNSPESALFGSTTSFDLCDSCGGGLEVQVTTLPQLGMVTVEFDAARGRWVATYIHDPTSDTSVNRDSFGVRIGRRGTTGGFIVEDETSVNLSLNAGG